MSKAEQFRRETAEFWSKMDQKGRRTAGAHEPRLTRLRKSDSGNKPGTRRRSALAIAAPARKTKKRTKR
jgi:hypothetical protein